MDGFQVAHFSSLPARSCPAYPIGEDRISIVTEPANDLAALSRDERGKQCEKERIDSFPGGRTFAVRPSEISDRIRVTQIRT